MILKPQIWYFRGLGLHERAPDDVLATLREQGRLERWGHQARIHRPGRGDEVYVVLDGNVYVHDASRESKPVRLRTGDLFGETDLGDDADALETHAFDDTTIVAAPRDLFDEVIRHRTGEMTTRSGIITGRKELVVPVAPLLYTTPAQRLARVLLHLAESRDALDGAGAELDIRLKSKKLGDLTGVVPEHAKKAVELLEKRGLIVPRRRSTLLPNVERLRHFSLRT
jgi:CRP-like cAMP-binding protein